MPQYNSSIQVNMEKKTPVFARISMGLILLPIGFFIILLAGGGSGGFRAWNDLAILMGMMFGIALLGYCCSIVSIKRNEQSLLNLFAIVIHSLIIMSLVYALNQ